MVQTTLTDTQTFTYDAMGNPTSYDGTTLTWEGKQLSGAGTTTFSYDENGLRTRKTVNGTVTDYYYNGSVLIGMVTGTGNTAVHQFFSYDASGNVVSVDYSSDGGSTFTTYYYLRNGQNDVVKLIDNSGDTVVEYIYDSWGRVVTTSGTLATTLGLDQPFRYRGYVYDTETGWYYLQSRYYNPQTCRFISADVLLSTGQGVIGNNSYAYCGNNPVIRADPAGYFPISSLVVIVVIVALLSAGVLPGCSNNSTAFYNPDGRTDIDLQYDGTSLSITAYVEFSGDGPDSDLIMDAIEDYWSGVYIIDGVPVTLTTNLIEGDSPLCGHLPIITSSEEGRCGSMLIYGGGRSEDNIKWTAAHEFGHQIGLHDAYIRLPDGNSQKNPDVYSIMNSRYTPVTAEDVRRVIKYIQTGEMQRYR